MEYVFLAGRILYGGFFLNAGVNHFRRAALMTPYTAAKGVPAPRLAVIGSGTLLVLGGLSIMLGVQPRWGAALLIVFLLPVTLIMHNFWADTEAAAKQVNKAMFQKNLALLGAALMLVLIAEPWPLSLGR